MRQWPSRSLPHSFHKSTAKFNHKVEINLLNYEWGSGFWWMVNRVCRLNAFFLDCHKQILAYRRQRWWLGQWCGSIGRAVTSDTRGPWFESSHRLTLYNLFTVQCIEKNKRPRSAQFLEFKHTVTIWNCAIRLDVASHVTIFNQWECIISA